MNATKNADKNYQALKAHAEARVTEIRNALLSHAASQAREPDAWGHVGDLGHVIELLDEIAQFLGEH